MYQWSKIIPVAIAFSFGNAWATDGYFSHGYSVRSQGVGGVGIALPQDALAAAANPAGMGKVGSRVDAGVTWFRPVRESEIEGSGAPGANGTYKGNDSQNFFIPEFGYNTQYSEDVTLGVSVYGNGGMNTDYKKGIPLFNSNGRRTGVDLAQVFVAPTVTWKVQEHHTLGVSLNLAYQRFEAKGLQNFSNASSSAANLTNNGHDDSYGAGVHIGWLGEITDAVTLGATYQSRTYMSRFDKYKGLFAEQGDFDIPSTYGVGVAVKVTPALTLAADFQRINYSEVDAVGNASLSNLSNGLGNDNGAGFNWQDAKVYKIGALYQYSPALILRAGYNHVDQPIRAGDTLFNILAPGVVKDHVSIGATWVLSPASEVSFAYTHAFENTVRGQNSIPAGFGGGDANVRMYQDALGVAYTWKL
ncbi:outer membrane protein transport protein [Methylophilus sp. VKM B-3414]|uniref:OmpP1/FadL family transporter n=1 Tax=Methylophilus sp. VKM B-3414 TaxID=3076121 RepID=UPI0028C90D35|nr:outer membrane protein transport protein [Methylophilus sp. VKM B-3414]MDT7849840.1 outer membrane protein transport protein [Methylophilus sp. VKM B-3414]